MAGTCQAKPPDGFHRCMLLYGVKYLTNWGCTPDRLPGSNRWPMPEMPPDGVQRYGRISVGQVLEWSLPLVAETEVHGEIRPDPPGVLYEQAELTLLDVVDGRIGAISARTRQGHRLADVAHAAGKIRVQRGGIVENGLRRIREVRVGEDVGRTAIVNGIGAGAVDAKGHCGDAFVADGLVPQIDLGPIAAKAEYVLPFQPRHGIAQVLGGRIPPRSCGVRGDARRRREAAAGAKRYIVPAPLRIRSGRVGLGVEHHSAAVQARVEFVGQVRGNSGTQSDNPREAVAELAADRGAAEHGPRPGVDGNNAIQDVRHRVVLILGIRDRELVSGVDVVVDLADAKGSLVLALGQVIECVANVVAAGGHVEIRLGEPETRELIWLSVLATMGSAVPW